MMKKNRLWADGSNISKTGNCQPIITKRTPKAQEAFIYISKTGQRGATENDIERISDPNPDGIGSHYRYRIRNRTDAQKIIDLINARAARGNYQGLSQEQINLILSLYPTE
ncbi:MAG: hypothetical protein ACRCZ3_08760 [Providencia rustigianii]|uniref:hypothetical protein n=1 Tax=Providencia rustigianii TaxID=158850 RepID=UPI003F30D157